MQAIAAIHGFDARVGAQRQCGLFLGPLGFKGRTFGQAPGFDLAAEFLSTEAVRSRVSCRDGPASANSDQGSDLRERCKDITLGERRRRPIRAARIGVVIDPLPDTANGSGGRFVDLHEVGPGVRPGRGILEAPVAFGPLPLEGRNRGVGGIRAALIDIPDVGPGDGVRGLQHVAPAPAKGLAVVGEVADGPDHISGLAGEVRMPVTPGVEPIGGRCDQIGHWVRDRAHQTLPPIADLDKLLLSGLNLLNELLKLQKLVGDHRALVAVERIAGGGEYGSFWVAPHVVSGSGFESALALSNPTGQAITVFVTLLSASGGAPHPSQSAPRRHPFNIPANGAVSIGAAPLTGLAIAPTVNGWIQVESPNLALAGTLVISRAAQRTAYPLDPIAASERLYLQTVGLNTELGGLVLVNLGDVVADIELAVLDKEGCTLARAAVTVGRRAKVTPLVGDLFPGVNLSEGRMLVLRSATPIYGALLAEAGRGLLAAATAGAALPELDRPASLRPRIASVEPEQVQPGDRLSLRIANSGFDFTVLLGGRPVTVRPLAPGISLVEFEVPNIKAGFVDLTIRSADGTVSRADTLRVAPSDAPPFREVLGRAFYEKIDIGRDGLDPSRPVLVPIRDAVVEVFARVSNQVFSAGYTDTEGAFRVFVPHGSEYAVRVLSRSSSSDVLVANNTNAGTIYSVNSDVDAARPPVLIASDANRISGAFNILEVIRQGNALLRRFDVNLPAPELGIFWSPANTPVAGDVATGQIGGTFFSAGNNTAFILGDRTTDSDEFDDAVILHEYAHGLATRFSRDDSRGGPHILGDVLDPRVAWSEGWANFFSALVRADPIYRDSRDPGGSLVLEYDLEENVPAGDRPGYRSEFSVHSMLWDLVDDIEDAGDVSEIPIAPIWEAFVELKDDRFVYLPSFLDRLVALMPSETFGIDQIARQRGIDYIAGAVPPVSNPFPQPVSRTEAVTGEVDSLSRGRANLAQSAHQYVFDVGGGAVSLRLDITGVGPGGNPVANDLDLFLMDLEGRFLALSDRGLNGQSELISTFLPAGRYVVEVRSFYTHGETGEHVFNAGAYRLEFSLP